MTTSSSSSAQACGPCKRGSDNRAWDCPPRMSDGRLFTDYRPRCDANLQFQAPMSGSHEYRQFLINNGQSIIDANRSAASSVAMCGPCVTPLYMTTMVPEVDRVICDKVSCSRIRLPAGAGGLGTGREYGMTADAKAQEDEFMTLLQARQNKISGERNCCGCASGLQGDFGSSYPGLAAVAPGPSRWSVPGGGTPMSGSDPSVSC